MTGRQATTRDARVELGPYLFQDVLGDGATGIVYRVVDPQGRHLALKVLRQELALNERERSRFLEEADRLRRVKHPALVEVVDAGVLPNGLPFIAMPFYSGCSLSHRLQRGPMSFDVALHLFQQLAEGLQTLHAVGLVHRDIKPENIFVAEGDRSAILLDLGIAREVNASPSTTTHAGLIRGTPAYMAPERFFGAPATPATDIYELGVVLYFTLVGALPWMRFDDPTERMRPAPPASRGVVLPPRLSSTLMRALAVSPGERPQSAHDFATAVIDALSPESVQQIASQATAFANRVPTGRAGMFAPTAMAASSAPPGSAVHSHAPAAYAPTMINAGALPQSGAVPAGAVPMSGASQQLSSLPPTAAPPKKRPTPLLVAAMTGATLLATSGLAIALFVKNKGVFSDAAQRAPVVETRSPAAEATAPGAGGGGAPAIPAEKSPLVVATPQQETAKKTPRPIASDRKINPSGTVAQPPPAPKDLGVGKDSTGSGTVAPNASASAKPKLPTPPPANPFPSESLANCRTVVAYHCQPEVNAVLRRCSGAQFDLTTSEKHTDVNLRKTIDMRCGSELRNLAVQAKAQ